MSVSGRGIERVLESTEIAGYHAGRVMAEASTLGRDIGGYARDAGRPYEDLLMGGFEVELDKYRCSAGSSK